VRVSLTVEALVVVEHCGGHLAVGEVDHESVAVLRVAPDGSPLTGVQPGGLPQDRFDGEGYPHRVDLASMPLAVRIVQVADAYDAMTSDRPYEPALPAAFAVEEITRCAGTQFDPDVAAALARLLEMKMGGQSITLPGSSDPLSADPFDRAMAAAAAAIDG
jgi:hypothetical protein